MNETSPGGITTPEIAQLLAIITRDRTDWTARDDAVRQLIAIGEPAVLPTLGALDALEADAFGTSTALLMRTLGELRDARAVEPLADALTYLNPHIRQAAATALGLIGDPRAIGPLINSFRIESGDTEDITAWQDASRALARIGTYSVPPLISALSDRDEKVRAGSADALGQIGDPQAVPALVAALADSDRQVRYDATVALGKIGETGSIEAVTMRLTDQAEDPSVRHIAARALGKMVRGRLSGPLLSALDDPDIELRCQCLWALAESAGSISVDLLLAHARDANACVRHAAVHALSKVGGESLIPLLEEIERSDTGACKGATVKGAARYAIDCIRRRHAKDAN